MGEEKRKLYQLLQLLAFYLSGDISKEELSKHKEIAILITDFLNLDFNDPELFLKIKTYFTGIFPELNPQSEDFYLQVYWKIEETLSEEKPLPSATLPPNLEQLIKDYELSLQQIQQEEVYSLFFQESPPSSYQELIEKIKNFLRGILNSKNEILIEHLAQKITQEVVFQIPPARDPSSFQASFPPEEHQKILEKSFLNNIPLSLQPNPLQLTELSEQTYKIIAQVSCLPHQTSPSALTEEETPPYPSPSPFLYQQIFSSLAKIASPEKTEAAKKAAEEATKQILLEIIQGEITPQKTQRVSDVIKSYAEKAGFPLPDSEVKNIVSQITPEISPLVALIENDVFRWQEAIHTQIQNLIENPSEVAKEAAQKIVSFTINFPQSSLQDLEEKLISFFPEELKNFPLAKKVIAQVAHLSDEEVLGRIYSLFPKFKPSLKKTLLSPLIKPLEFLVNLAPEEYRQKHLGLVYAAKGFTPYNVKALINKINDLWPQSLQLKFWQKVSLSFADTEVSPLITLFNRFHSSLDFKKFSFRIFYQSENRLIKFLTFGKIKNLPDLKRSFWTYFKNSKIGAFFARTAGGFLKKITQWLGVKIGGRLGLSAMASFFATPLGGIATFLLTSIPSFFKKIFKKGADKTKNFFSFTSKTGSHLIYETAGFLTRSFYALSSVSFSSLSGIGVGGVIIILAVLILLIVFTTGGAFLEEGKGTTPGYIGKQISPRSPEEAAHLAEKVIWTLNQCGITEINPSTWEATQNCLLFSSLPNPEIIVERFRYSVFDVGPALQCVGFVRGVMAALGKDPGGGKHAFQYLDPPVPSGYILSNDPNKVEIGDLAVMRAGEFGHIGIVVNKEGDYIWLAQAFGDKNGKISITEIKPIYFDGFLRPQ